MEGWIEWKENITEGEWRNISGTWPEPNFSDEENMYRYVKEQGEWVEKFWKATKMFR